MSWTPAPGRPPERPPPGYGSYGGDLQSYGQPVAPPGHAPPYGNPPAQNAATPAQHGGTAPPGPLPPRQRPVQVGLAANLAVTGSVLWIVTLSFGWLVATVGARQLGTTGVDGALYHLLHRFDDRLLDGLAWPLFGFPLASSVAGFLLLTRQAWARRVFTAVGATALVWSAWWLRSDLEWWLPAAGYVILAVLLVWMPSVNGWLRRPDPASSGPGPQPR